MDQTASRKPLTLKVWVQSLASPVTFVKDKVALTPFSSQFFGFPFSILHQCSTLILILSGTQAEEAWEPPKKAILFQISMSNAKNTVQYAKH